MSKIQNKKFSVFWDLKFEILNLFRISDFGFRISSNRAFSLVETLFYVALLALSLLVVMQTLVALTRSFAVFRAAAQIEQSATLSLERMVREIRDARDISDAGSVLGTHPGRLLLDTTTAAGAARAVEFSVNGGALVLTENGTVTGSLTGSTTNVSNLVFRKITTARSRGVKIEIALSSGSGAAARSENFYTTAVLRDSY